MNEQTYVYLIAAKSGHFKVGVAKNIQARLKSLQNGNPYKLTVVAEERLKNRELAFQAEAAVHSALAGGRVEGEWFDCDIETAKRVMVDAVERVKRRHPAFVRKREAERQTYLARREQYPWAHEVYEELAQ